MGQTKATTAEGSPSLASFSSLIPDGRTDDLMMVTSQRMKSGTGLVERWMMGTRLRQGGEIPDES